MHDRQSSASQGPLHLHGPQSLPHNNHRSPPPSLSSFSFTLSDQCSSDSISLLQKLTSTLLLLTVGYLACKYYDSQTSQLLPDLQDLAVYLIPSRLIHAVEQCLHKFGRLSHTTPSFTTEKFGNHTAKRAALSRMVASLRAPIRSVVNQARSMSTPSKYQWLGGMSDQQATPPGLTNGDVGCYENSIIQALASLPAFVSFIKHAASDMDSAWEQNNTVNTLNRLFAELDGDDRYSSRRRITLPSKLKPMDQSMQQDVSDYFQKIIEAVEEDNMRSIGAKTANPGLETIRKRKFNESETYEEIASKRTNTQLLADQDKKTFQPTLKTDASTCDSARGSLPRLRQLVQLTNPLEGLERNTKTCPKCQTSEHSCPPFKFIALHPDNDRTVSKSKFWITRYTKEGLIDGESDCDTCTRLAEEALVATENNITSFNGKLHAIRKKVKSVKMKKRTQTTFARLPKNLVFYISRTHYLNNGHTIKNNVSVQPSSTLEVPMRWCDPSIPYKNTDLEGTIYDLRGVVVHLGPSAKSGHYFAYAKRGKSWFKFDDVDVTECDEQEVFTEGGTSMLFYERIATPPGSEAEAELATTLPEPALGTAAVEVSEESIKVESLLFKPVLEDQKPTSANHAQDANTDLAKPGAVLPPFDARPVEYDNKEETTATSTAARLKSVLEAHKPTSANHAQDANTELAKSVADLPPFDIRPVDSDNKEDTTATTTAALPESVEMSRSSSSSEGCSSSPSSSAAPYDEPPPVAAVVTVPPMRTATALLSGSPERELDLSASSIVRAV